MRAARSAVIARSGGRCELRVAANCARIVHHVHHIRRRSQGGGDDADNLLGVCSPCHDYVHAHPDWAQRHGALVRTGDPHIWVIAGCGPDCEVDHRGDPTRH
jgi:hypothetical protein